MKFKSVLLTILLAIFYPFAYLQRVNPKKVTFISLGSSKLHRDFRMIYDELVKENQYEIKTILFHYRALNRLEDAQYALVCIRQLFAIFSSGLIILDYNNFVVSTFKHKKETKVLQVWHATGALKKFGNVAAHSYEIKNYDLVLANADDFKAHYAKAFNVREDQVAVTGIPYTDVLFDETAMQKSRERLLAQYPDLQGKKIILYAPTFRGRVGTEFREIIFDLAAVQQELGAEYCIVYKPHPLIKTSKYEKSHAIHCLKNESIYDLLSIADLLISDYSAVVFDSLVFKIPIISYCPDIETYRKLPGLFLDYENEFPGPIVKAENELIQVIRAKMQYNKDIDKQEAFYHSSFKYTDGRSKERVIALINQLME